MKKGELNFLINLKTFILKFSAPAILLQLKICVRNKQEEKDPDGFSPVFSEITKLFGLLVAGDKIVVPEELKRQVVDELHFGHLSSTKMLAESKMILRPGMRKDIENKCSTCNASMSSGENLRYQLPSTEKIKLLVLAEHGQEIQFDFSGNLYNKHVTGKLSILIGIDRYSKWPVVRICKLTETKEVKKF